MVHSTDNPLAHPKLDLKWKHRIRLAINYFNRNFYQQLLFFVLPLYYMSTTPWSKNMVFIVLVAASAVLSTMDIVYDRVISVKGFVMSMFFAFNLFAGINVMLPIIWGVRTIHAVRVSAIVAFLGFATFCFQLTHLELEEKVGHIWYLNGKKIYASQFYHINGHKDKGFRLWTFWTLRRIPPDSVLTIRVETEGGQLIGRASLESLE